MKKKYNNNLEKWYNKRFLLEHYRYRLLVTGFEDIIKSQAKSNIYYQIFMEDYWNKCKF